MQTNNHSFVHSFIHSFVQSTNLRLYGSLPRWGTYPGETLSLDGVVVLDPFSLCAVLLMSVLTERSGQAAARPHCLLENHADPQPTYTTSGSLSTHLGPFRKPYPSGS